MQKVSDIGDHVDVFEAIGAVWNAETDAFSKISHAMYFEQKAMMRELVINPSVSNDAYYRDRFFNFEPSKYFHA